MLCKLLPIQTIQRFCSPLCLIEHLRHFQINSFQIAKFMIHCHNQLLPPMFLNLFVTDSLGAVSRKPRKLFGPVKPLQNLEPCEYRAVLFTYSKDEGRFPSYKKFRAYTPPFLDTYDLKMALRARKLSGAFEKRAPGTQLWHENNQ